MTSMMDWIPWVPLVYNRFTPNFPLSISEVPGKLVPGHEGAGLDVASLPELPLSPLTLDRLPVYYQRI